MDAKPTGELSDETVRTLFRREVPEIAAGIVEIRVVARLAGIRTKIAVRSTDSSVDAIASCVGHRGARVERVATGLGGEPIDIVEWSDAPERRVRRALAPVTVSAVVLDQETGRARVTVARQQPRGFPPLDETSLALANRLSGWQIEVQVEP